MLSPGQFSLYLTVCCKQDFLCIATSNSFFFLNFLQGTPPLSDPFHLFYSSSFIFFCLIVRGRGSCLQAHMKCFFKMNRVKDFAKRRGFQKCLSNATWEWLESQHTVSDWLEKSRRRKVIPKQDSGLLRNCLALMFCYDLIIFMFM